MIHLGEKYINSNGENSRLRIGASTVYSKDSPKYPTAYLGIAAGTDIVNPLFIDDYIGILPPGRRARAERYRNISDKVNCIVSYLMLKDLLQEHYGIEDPGDFILNEHGKPFLKGNSDIYFSISHTKNAAVVAVAGFEIGVDIESFRRLENNLIDMVATENEKKCIEAASDRNRAFFRLWTMKESYAKSYGLGIADILKKDTERYGYIYIDDDRFQAAVYLGRYRDLKENIEIVFSEDIPDIYI